MAEEKTIGHRVIGIIKNVKGKCSAGHKSGDEIELSLHKTGGCAELYHDVYPYVVMLQMRQFSCGVGIRTRSNLTVWINIMQLLFN